MENNRDWKGPVALVLAGLALFVALNGGSFGPGSTEVGVWRVERNAKRFFERPIPTVPPVEPAVPKEFPGFEKEFPGFNKEIPGLDKKLEFLQPPNIEAYIDSPPGPWSDGWPGSRYVQSLIEGGLMSMTQLLQPILLLLLVWLIVRQLGRNRAAPAPAPGGQTEDLSRRPPDGSA